MSLFFSSFSRTVKWLVGAVITLFWTGMTPEAQAQGNPAGWQNGDIGNVGAAGSSDFSQVASGSVTVRGSGADIYGTADAFQFAYRTLSGDGQIIARIDSQQNTNSWAKAGLMIRESLSANARHAMVAVTPNNGVSFVRRTDVGGASTSTNGLGIKAPWWLKLVRSGDQFLAYAHRDGDGWVFLGQQTLPMGAQVLVGLSVTSHANSVLSTAVFSSVSISNTIEGDPWLSRQIGSGAVPGGASYDEGTDIFSVKGAGASIWGSADTFHFLSQTLEGDGQIKARIAGLSGGDVSAKAGLMLRLDDQNNSPNALVTLIRGTGLSFQRRVERGGSTTTNQQPGVVTQQWLKLVRAGDEFSGYSSPDGQNWSFLGADVLEVPESLLAGVAVNSHQSGALAEGRFQGIEVEPAIEPFGWLGQNVGVLSATVVGSSNYDPSTGIFTVNGSGSNIWDGQDAFHFVWQPLAGDSEIEARITSQQNTNEAAKAGVMIRENGAANARNVLLAVTPGNGLILQKRTATGGLTTRSIVAANYTLPIHLKLRQTGSLVTAFTSQNGSTWQTVGTVELGTALGAETRGGLAVTSRNSSLISTARFDLVNRAFTPFGGLYSFARTATSIGLRWTAYPSIAPAYFNLYNGASLLDSTAAKSLTLTGLAPQTTLNLTVRPFNAYGQSIASDQALSVGTLGLNTLPSPWQTADLGSLAPIGGVSFEEGKFAIVAKGTEAQRLIYQSGWNDVTVTASLKNEDDDAAPQAHPALIIREDLSSDSPFISFGLDAGAAVLWKREVSGGSVSSRSFPLDATWSDTFKLTRTGASYTASGFDIDGTQRTLASGETSLSSGVIAGLTLRVNDATAIHTATFRNVEFTGGDSDSDSMPDAWEQTHGLDPGNSGDASGDLDGDGISNLQEYQADQNPNDYYNGVAPSLEIVSGNGQSAEANGQFSQPLRVRVRNSGGQVLVNAPVGYTVQSGTGNFSILNGVARTGADGIASISFQTTSEAGASVVIAACAGLANSVAFNLLLPFASEPPTTMEGTLEAWIVSPHRVTLTWSGVTVANCLLERRTGTTGEWTLEREVTAPGGGEALAFITSAEERVSFRLRTVAPQASSVTAAVPATVHSLPAGLISLPMSSCVESFNGRGQFGYVGLDGVVAKAWDGEKWQTLPGDPLGPKSVGGVNEAGDISGSVNRRAVVWRWNSQTRLYVLEYISGINGFDETYAGGFWRDGTLNITAVNIEQVPISSTVSHFHALKWVPLVGWIDLGDQGSGDGVFSALGFAKNTTYYFVGFYFRNAATGQISYSLPDNATAIITSPDSAGNLFSHDPEAENPVYLPVGAVKDYPESVITGYEERRTESYFLCPPGTLNAYSSPLFSYEPDSSRAIGAYNDTGDRLMLNPSDQFEVQLADGNVRALTGLPQPKPSLSALGHFLQVGGHFVPQEDPDETDYDGRPFIQFPAIGDKPADTSFLQLIEGLEEYGGRVQSMNRYGSAVGASDFGEGGGVTTGFNPVLWGPEGHILSLSDRISVTLPGLPNAFGYTYPFWYVGPTSINDAGMILCASTELLEENPSQRRLLLPFDIEGYKRGTINTPGAKVPKGSGEYGQETVMMENADSEDNTTRPDYVTTAVDAAADDDLVKVVLRWPKDLKISGVKLELKHKGMEVDPTKTSDADKYMEVGSSRLNFYKPDGTKLTPADLKIDDLGTPSTGYLAEILTTGELTLFIEGTEKFGLVGNDPKSAAAAKKLGGAMLNFEVTRNGSTSRSRLLVYRGGFLVFRMPRTTPPLPPKGVLGSFEFYDGKGRVKHKFGGKGNEFQEDVTDWGSIRFSWPARSGRGAGLAYNRVDKDGHVPPGWWLVSGERVDWNQPKQRRQTDYEKTDTSGINYLNQGGYCRWLADDAVGGTNRYTNDYKYYASLSHDVSVGDPVPTRRRFKFDVVIIPDSEDFGRYGVQIHPDGEKNGTAGCIGIQKYEDCAAVYRVLSRYHGLKIKVILE